jgi:hypothetical protein
MTTEVFAEFMLGEQSFDAIRVRWTGKTAPTREKAIQIVETKDRHVIRSEEDWAIVFKNRCQLPDIPGSDMVYIFTARPHPENPSCVSGFRRANCKCWDYYWVDIYRPLYNGDLILRRRL